MFYLLENNRIIDTNDKTFKKLYTCENGVTCYSIETPNETHHHCCLGGGEYEDNTYEFHSASIKKQSENVFDLVEKGDLIKVNGNKLCPKLQLIFKVNSIYIYDDGTKEFSILGMGFEEKNVSAIYKPNSNGDYIKVWEVKNEKED